MNEAREISRAIVKAVQKLGQCTISQITAEVGHLISASRANRKNSTSLSGKGTKCHSIGAGKRRLVSDYLRRAKDMGKIIRVDRGVYAPLPLKVFSPRAS